MCGQRGLQIIRLNTLVDIITVPKARISQQGENTPEEVDYDYYK